MTETEYNLVCDLMRVSAAVRELRDIGPFSLDPPHHPIIEKARHEALLTILRDWQRRMFRLLTEHKEKDHGDEEKSGGEESKTEGHDPG